MVTCICCGAPYDEEEMERISDCPSKRRFSAEQESVIDRLKAEAEECD
jgi:DNA-directed RNA polymerase subunit RPC12/RpoP